MAIDTLTTKAEHLAWCKTRALEYVDLGDVAQAVASMVSDLNKHPETQHLARDSLGILSISMRTPDRLKADMIRRWIENGGGKI